MYLKNCNVAETDEAGMRILTGREEVMAFLDTKVAHFYGGVLFWFGKGWRTWTLKLHTTTESDI